MMRTSFWGAARSNEERGDGAAAVGVFRPNAHPTGANRNQSDLVLHLLLSRDLRHAIAHVLECHLLQSAGYVVIDVCRLLRVLTTSDIGDSVNFSNLPPGRLCRSPLQEL